MMFRTLSRLFAKPSRARSTSAKNDGAPAAIQAAIAKVPEFDSFSSGGELIQTTSGFRQQRMDPDHLRGGCWLAFSKAFFCLRAFSHTHQICTTPT
jgi:hypothetical protein